MCTPLSVLMKSLKTISFFCILLAYATVPYSSLSAGVFYQGIKGIRGPFLMDLDLEAHEANDIYLIVSNMGPIGNNLEGGSGGGIFPRGTLNNYVFGTGVWIGGIADVDGSGTPDTVLTQAYNPQAGATEFREGRVEQSPSDPLARIFDSLDPLDFLEWPSEFSWYDPVIEDTVPLIYSTQDLVTIYTTIGSEPIIGIGNLPFEIRQRSMAFIGDDIGQVIYAIFDIENVSGDTPEGPYTIEGAWIGYESDMDIGVSFGDDQTSVMYQQVSGLDTLALDMGIAWDSDFEEANFTERPGFVGVTLLQSPGDATDGIDNDGDGVIDESTSNGIDDDGDGEIDEPDEVDELGLVNYSKHCSPSQPCDVLDPDTDPYGYDIISCNSPGSGVTCLEDPTAADVRYMISSGPFDWLPGETVRLVIAFVFAEPVGEPTQLDLVGDPPRPDPNDPVLARLVEVTLTARDFWFTGFEGYETPLDILWTTDLDDTNNPISPYEVTSNVIDSVGIHSVTLFTSIDEEPFIEFPMTHVPLYLYTTDIPAAPFGTTFRYYVQAVDSLFNVVRDPDNAPLTTFEFRVVDAPTFTDITRQVGMFVLETVNGAVWFDFDLDGDDDLFVMGISQSFLFRNDGDFVFTDVTLEAGLEDIHWDGVQAADYDNDGDPDLYVTSYAAENLLYRNNGDGTFEEVAEAAGVNVGTGTRGAVWGDYDRDGYLDIFLFGHNQFVPLLFRNLGDGTFEEVSEAAGVDEIAAITTDAAAFFDRDRDGDLDIYLVTNGENVLFDNNGNGTFTDRTVESGLSNDMSVEDLSLVDYDNDGDIDIFVLNNGENRLFRNDGSGSFLDVADAAGVSDFGANACSFADVNLDGYSDLLLSSPGLLINNGDGTFTEHSEFAGLSQGGRLIISADLAGDGLLDLYDSYLYMNEGYPIDIGRNWLSVELEGTRSPKDGTGSLVEVVTDGFRQVKVYGEGTGNSMGSLPVEFGLNSAMVVDELLVHWPSGIVQELTSVMGNQVVRVVEDSTLTGIGGGPGNKSSTLPKVFSLVQNYPNPFNPSTTIRYDIPSGIGKVSVKVLVYDVRGRLIRKLVDREREPGRYQVHWNGRDGRGGAVSSGVYLYRIEAGEFRSTRKMTLVR